MPFVLHQKGFWKSNILIWRPYEWFGFLWITQLFLDPIPLDRLAIMAWPDFLTCRPVIRGPDVSKHVTSKCDVQGKVEWQWALWCPWGLDDDLEVPSRLMVSRGSNRRSSSSRRSSRRSSSSRNSRNISRNNMVFTLLQFWTCALFSCPQWTLHLT